MTITLKVEGMSCSHCSTAVTNALMQIDKVQNVEIDLALKTVKIDCLQGTKVDLLKQAIEDIGFDVKL